LIFLQPLSSQRPPKVKKTKTLPSSRGNRKENNLRRRHWIRGRGNDLKIMIDNCKKKEEINTIKGRRRKHNSFTT
jgi:hypothetical protein